jgi:hypothetical protein
MLDILVIRILGCQRGAEGFARKMAGRLASGGLCCVNNGARATLAGRDEERAAAYA